MGVTEDSVETVDHPLVVPEAIERRPYQTDVVDVARRNHTLVCLPTGLGKTSVSLLVTAERLRERSDGQVLFLAPTKPLVEQHAAFYRESLAIPGEKIVVFTGEVAPATREGTWDDARIVIATPQVIENDLIGDRISLAKVVHLTFDECHRATGGYAYNYIAERYHETAENPLVTGMSASPGGSREAILTVCRNLGIEEIAVKTEEDPDVEVYTYDTDLEWETVELPEEIKEIRSGIQEVIEDRLDELRDLGVTRASDPELSQRELDRIRGKIQGLIDGGNPQGYRAMSLHAELMKLKRAVEVADTQSVAALRRYFERQEEAARSSGASKASKRLVSEPRVRRAIERADAFEDTHPKFSRARILIAKTLGIQDGDRVIVFTESRDTAEVLTEFLGQSFETRRFVGQGDRDGSEGMTQREQQEVLDAFRRNEFEVLVSTSVAEEGLDVPEVDLVLFFEPVPTAIRAIQRRGRTGRHAPGRVVVLMAEDTRDEAYFWISRRREQEMADELRSLKDLEGDLEAELRGTQGDLESFDATRHPSDGETSESTGGNRLDGQAGLAAFEEREPEEEDDGSSVASAGGGDAVEIVADQRELEASIGRELSKRDGFSVRLETLEVGDYVLSDRVVVERKTVEDFLDTLLGSERSLFEQVRGMTEHYDRPLVIVEGEDLMDRRNVHPNAIRGALASVAIDFGASVLFTSDASDTTDLLATIAEREQQHGGRSVSVHGEKGGRTLSEQQEYVLSSLAAVGPVTSRSLLEALGSVEAVITADRDELMAVDGVGEVTAERIRKVVSTEYDPT